ncbi:orotate phosphoribosyltransferase [Paenactinomyces guangxiensis]|uniref:Orotate phosphoribosyltransferase n=1 Tax=Paenactinomyces guangxiensis TaxID=1490290 RepID=A0A7W1WQI7_9BACL|nr:orotate phosphoribosyltransferase [Paenactinomyces guangxiensis]MBA4494215.1 orotate phosphoribosyltransferase [Paenactinomyces guangxiensis]MBH8590711.1 orotate phosphoribosyltransferase [Paenactinomyces guangxiensis]
MNKEWNLDEAIRRTGVLKEGHFLLTSGRHSAQYMQCAQLLQYPGDAEAAGQALAALFRDEQVDVVVGPALGGVIIAHEVARALGVRCLFAERKEGKMELRRGFAVQPGERVLVIEDVVTTGGSVQEVVNLLEAKGAKIAGIGSIVDRSGGKTPFQYPYRALTAIEIQSYTSEDCPLCKEGLPAVKPGSRATVNG